MRTGVAVAGVDGVEDVLVRRVAADVVTVLPVKPREATSGWAWSSWPSAGFTPRRPRVDRLSSGSVTVHVPVASVAALDEAAVGPGLELDHGLRVADRDGSVVVPVLSAGSVTVSRAL